MTGILRRGQPRALRTMVGAYGIVILTIGILVSACEPNRPTADPRSKCRVEGNDVFLAKGFKIDHYHPNDCPRLIRRDDPHAYDIPAWYQATEAVHNSQVNDGAVVVLRLEDARGGALKTDNYPLRAWSDGFVRADVSGLFRRATIELCHMCRFNDFAYHWVVAKDNQLAEGTVEMPYYDTYTGHVRGPTWCPGGGWGCTPGAGSSFSLRVDLDNAFNGPYLYEWFRDGVSMGPPSGSNTITDYGDMEGTHQTYQVAITDTLRARVMSEQLRVWIPYSEQSGCDPTAIQCPE